MSTATSRTRSGSNPNHEILPIEIWTPENVPTPVEEYEGPEGYQDQFMELWGIGG